MMSCWRGRQLIDAGLKICYLRGMWQPIETAPKDGTLIDLWLDGERAPACRFWSYDGHSYWEQAYAEATDCFAPLYDAEPTHWMPIPEPPAL